MMNALLLHITPIAMNIAVAVAALATGRLAYWLGFLLLHRLDKFIATISLQPLIINAQLPMRWLLSLLSLGIGVNWMTIPPLWKEHLNLLLRPVTVGVVGWLAISMTLAAADILKRRYAWNQTKNNLAARRISTQLRVFQNVALFIIILLTIIAMAMTIPGLRTLGISLFASAGVAGLVIGMAARPALSNLIAGVQLALTQPIRLDDVVIIEGEWGRILEITATYVVVGIWDQRQLMVPLSYFIEKPFQNWTHASSELMGTVFLYLDYTAPVDAIRGELRRIVENSELWDKRVCIVQVTDSKESTLELRALISANDAAVLWDLRCEVREKLVAFLQRDYPQCLPRTRVDFTQNAVQHLSESSKSGNVQG